jgi:hypothetical protein
MKVDLIHQKSLDNQINWIAEFGQKRNRIGFNSVFDWYLQTDGAISNLKSIDSDATLLPILEIKRDVLDKHIQKLGFSTSALEAFPEKRVLAHAINYPGSSYWIEKAMDWIVEKPRLIDELIPLMDRKTIEVNLPQKTKHRFQRIFKKL